MTKAEITQLKDALTADYKRKLEALELVEQMLSQQQKSQSPATSVVGAEGQVARTVQTISVYTFGSWSKQIPPRLAELLGVGLFVWRKETHAAAEPISLAMVAWRAANNAAASRRPCEVSW